MCENCFFIDSQDLGNFSISGDEKYLETIAQAKELSGKISEKFEESMVRNEHV